MLIHLDSSFAQFNESPKNETLQIPINSRNSQSLQDEYTTSTSILMSFKKILPVWNIYLEMVRVFTPPSSLILAL